MPARVGVAGCRFLASIAAEHGLAPLRLLKQCGIDEAVLEDHEASIDGSTQIALMLRLIDQLGDRSLGLGLECGVRMKTTYFGSWGFTLLCSSSLHDAIQFTREYGELAGAPLSLAIDMGTQETGIVLDAGDLPRAARPFATEWVAAAIITLQKDILDTGMAIPLRKLWFAHPAQAPLERYRAVFGTLPEFNRPRTEFAFDSRLLGLSLPRHDALTRKTCIAHCNALRKRQQASIGIAGRVRERLARDPSALPTFDEVAHDLGITKQKLRRALADEHTNYRKLVDGLKQTLSVEMIARPDASITVVASQLGYDSVTGFKQSFRRWTGGTPRAWRRRNDCVSRHLLTHKPDTDMPDT